ncbi:MAG: A/G-specific adenine glycosylase [Pirellulales bacterium]
MPTATDRSQFTAENKRILRRRLLAWYTDHARDLPWRRSSDPYRVWVSEIMLQQTQVATVREYFKRFIRALPDVHSLAAADEQQVLRLWEGLGYYRRARQLHAAARLIVAEHGGFPQSVDGLMKLPGVGRYTAGAIASIAFGQRAPILEANTIRLLSRLIGYRDDPLRSAGQRVLWQAAAEILPRTDVARFNQALMELGSLVCTPTDPRCHECPLAGVCAANAAGLQHEIPREKPRQQYTAIREAAIIVRRNGRVLMRQCGEGERWVGLWDFPRFALESEGPLFAQEEITAKVSEQTGIQCEPGPLLKTIKHGVTRYRITLDCYEADYASGTVRDPARWIKSTKLIDLPLSTTGRKIAGLIMTKKPRMNADERRSDA